MFQALSSKASDLINAQAGLLTRFRYKHLPGNYPSGYWHFAYAFSETYSSGTVQDSHLDSLLIIHLGGEINEPMDKSWVTPLNDEDREYFAYFRTVCKRYNIDPSRANRLEYDFVTRVAESEFYLQKAAT